MSVSKELDDLLNQVSLKDIPSILPLLPEEAQVKLLEDLELLGKLKTKEQAQDKFMHFVKQVWPNFINGDHHEKMAAAFERVASGEIKRLIINMPPRHTKSEFASYLLPAWFLGKFPQKKVIQTSHTAELAVGFGRKVRNLVDSEIYKTIFPGVGLQADSKAAGRWATNSGGDYFAIGIGGAVTGKGADILIIDDPHSEQEAALAEVNPEVYDKTYEWYTSGPRQRLQPGGAIIIVMCMTGDTLVLMADSTEKPLCDVRPGDVVATFDHGRLATTTVLNHQSNGVDSIYQIQTLSGRILRANERHPFLVLNEGVLEWTRLKDLRAGDALVSLKDVLDPPAQKQNPDFAAPVWQESHTTAKTQTPQGALSDTTVSGRTNSAPAENPLAVKGCASSATENSTPHQSEPPSKVELRALNTGTASLLSSTTQWLKSAATSVMSVASRLLGVTRGRTGVTSSASTTTMTPGRFAAFCATTAILRSGMEKRQTYLNELQRTSDFTVDPIVSITYAGEEEVFDVQIERTENFIANGVVSHNTRWSKKDLTGQVLKSAAQREGEDWEVIEFPALFEGDVPLWPEFWSQKELLALRNELPVGKWMAQYMQQPTSEVSAIVKREWWQIWEQDDPPYCEFIIQSWDTAFSKSERADFSACTTWGVFYHDDDTGKPQANIILLNALKKRMEFPELKQKAYAEYKEWEPDSLIIEAKASGAPLVFELRAMGLPVQEYTPSKGNDKISRLNSVADIFASGRVWVPETRWAEELVEEVASFPSGEHDDLVDSMTQALIRFRRGGFIRLESDYEDEMPTFRGKGTKRLYNV